VKIQHFKTLVVLSWGSLLLFLFLFFFHIGEKTSGYTLLLSSAKPFNDLNTKIPGLHSKVHLHSEMLPLKVGKLEDIQEAK